MVKVKICGITNIEDALAAVNAGADALGFIFAESPRKVSAEVALEILKQLPPFITTVGVFANQHADEVLPIMEQTGLDYAQLHGDMGNPFEFAKVLGCRRLIRALRIKSEEDIKWALADCPKCGSPAFHLDAHVEGMMGGTGRTFDWNLAIKAKSLGKPIILAGGLTSENVAEAVQMVQPYAVDVSTGVEASPGKKDHRKIEEFIRNAKKSV
jgi:phosphoribosylanthranilate isomerase